MIVYFTAPRSVVSWFRRRFQGSDERLQNTQDSVFVEAEDSCEPLGQLVIGEVERPLFKAVMDYTQGNQSQAAGILGINRGTLRKKLRTYLLIK